LKRLASLPLIRAELQRRRLPRPGPLLHDLSQVLYLPFDHDDGSYARDRGGYVNHGIVYGAARVAGKVGSALGFDGVDDYVRVPDSASLDVSDAVTMAAWVRPAPMTHFEAVMRKETAYLLERRGADLFAPVLYIDGEYRAGPGIPYTVDEWVHVAGTYDSETREIRSYRNGELVGTTTLTGLTTFKIAVSALDLYVGSFELIAGFFFNGVMDEIRLYNRALSAAEIARLTHLRGI